MKSESRKQEVKSRDFPLFTFSLFTFMNSADAVIGDTRAARRAGTSVAAIAAVPRTALAMPNVTGSKGLTW